MRSGFALKWELVLAILFLSGVAHAQQFQHAMDDKRTFPSVPVPIAEPAPTETRAPVMEASCVKESEGGESPYFFTADYLLLKPRRSYLDYAIVGPTNPSNAGPIGSVQTLEFDWTNAFRVGGGYRLRDGLEIGFDYTYLHSDRQSGVNGAPPGGTILPTLTQPSTVLQVNSAEATNSLNYNVFDLDLGKTFHPSETLTVRVFGGARFAEIDQNLTAVYNGGDANLDRVATDLRFSGAGLTVGGEANLDLYYGWGAYARGRFSMVLGQYNSSLLETNNAGATVITNVSDHFDKLIPVLELGMGVSWQSRNWRLTAGYELTNWFGLVDSPDFTNDVSLGKSTRRISDLSLDGLAVRAIYSF